MESIWKGAGFGPIPGIPEEPKPMYNRPRVKCPFYGFQVEGKKLIDTGENHCPIYRGKKTDHRCEMDQRETFPHWDKCFLNTKANMKHHEDIYFMTFYPKEFAQGIHPRIWKKYVMKNN